MKINKLNPEFAETGAVDTDAIFETWASAGWIDERVRYKGINKQFNRQDVAINDLINGTPPAVPGDERSQSVALNMYSNCFGSMLDGSNRFRLTSGSSCYMSAYPTTINGIPKILCIDQTQTAEVTVFDVETGTVDAQVDLSGGLGVGTWRPQAVVADGTNAYFCFEDGSYNQYVQAYNMLTWDVADGWPAAGTDYGTGSGFAHPVGMVHADADFLAIASNHYNVSTGTPTMLTLIDKSDGSIDDTGNGDSAATGTQYIYALCSNGTYIFFVCDETICSANIADLSLGCGGSNWPLAATSSQSDLGGISCAGDIVVAAGGGSANPFCYIAHVDNAKIGKIVSDDTSFIKNIQAVAYDGMRFWGIGAANINITTDRMMLFQLNIEKYINENGSTEDIFSGSVGIVRPFGIDLTYNIRWTTLIHDGRDFWFTGGEPSGGPSADTQGDYLFRFPLTQFR